MAALLLFLVATSFALSPQFDSRGAGPAARERVRQAVASTGLVLVRNSNEPVTQNPRPKGSAVIVRSDGIAVTNAHVIIDTRTGRPYDEIFFDLGNPDSQTSLPKRYRLKPDVVNREYDLALLRVQSEAASGATSKAETFPAVQIGDSKSVQLLDDLFIIGFPDKGGTTVTVNHGVVEGKDPVGNWIKTDARMIHGNSGGAAVNIEGKLIGIPTKVVADEQIIDRNGDGVPDEKQTLGAVGFLRPAHLVTGLLAKLGQQQNDGASATTTTPPPPTNNSPPRSSSTASGVVIRGVVRSSTGKPVAGAIVGLLAAGAATVSETNLLSWGSANGEGRFSMNRPVSPGKYSLRVKALGYEPYARETEIAPNQTDLTIVLRPSLVR